jgi:NitT/TauT family transport system substrate-binding protein
MQPLIRITLVISILLGVSACGPSKSAETESVGLRKVFLQTDWFPQAEHGGFYQALAKGFYKEVGLDVTILQGGPNSMSTQKVLRKKADFAMNRADTVFGLVQKGVPVTFIMSTLQHDPQALMLHAENPISSFKELDGQRIMATPGLMWVKWIQKKYNIAIEIIPHDYGIDRFLNDPQFIQQCLLTNEPFYVMQNGTKVKVLAMNESGFDPYHGIYCLNSLISDDPQLVQDFVNASIKGWRDFNFNDPQPAFDLIASKNPKMTPEFLRFSYDAMKNRELIAPVDQPETVGQMNEIRLQKLVDEMRSLELIDTSMEEEIPWFTKRFLSSEGN